MLIDRTVPGIESDVVLGDSFGGARQLVEHLISLGHRRIGFIVESDEVSTARDRRRGYESALTAAGIPARSGARRRRDSRSRPAVTTGMRRLLELEDPPTAVFTVNNLVALGAIEAVRAAGLEVPDDVALVCFDDIEYALAPLSLPHRDGATRGGVRDAGHAAPARSARRARASSDRVSSSSPPSSSCASRAAARARSAA